MDAMVVLAEAVAKGDTRSGFSPAVTRVEIRLPTDRY